MAAALLIPGLAQAQGKAEFSPKVKHEKMARDLGLTPDKAKAFIAIGEKYERSRKDIVAGIKKNEQELEKAMAAPQPDGAEITGLVDAVITGHNQLWETFQNQRREEMALLTPVQKGKFLMALKKWHREMCEQYEKKGK